jgi:hypothetical protein|tara:strand:- start:1315 stop:1686 length:372 start_codon:yes stop_codon:yes gene_type:complete
VTERAGSGIQPQTLMIAGIVGLIGFLGNDFVEGRDSRTASVESVLREQLTLKLAPLAASVAEIKTDLRTTSDEARARFDAMRSRVGDMENKAALMEREMQGVSERIGRLSDIIRERSLERMEK